MKKIQPFTASCLLLFIMIAAWVAWRPVPERPHAVTPPAEEAPAQVAVAPTPLPDPAPPSSDSVITQLRLAANPGPFMETLRQVAGVEKAEFDAKSSNLVISHRPDGPSSGKLAELATQANLVVLGEVLDLPLAFGEKSHLSSCGSCGFEVHQELEKKPGVHAVEVFLPVENQLRLLVVPESITPSEIDRFFAEPRHANFTP